MPLKTVSFKGERKRTGRRFLKQSSGHMSNADVTSDGDVETAIAAAAYAIAFIEEESSPDQEKATKRWRKTPSKTYSKSEDRMHAPTDTGSTTALTDGSAANKLPDTSDTNKKTDTTKISRWLSGKETKEDKGSTGERSMRKSVTFDQSMLEEGAANADGQLPRKTTASGGKTNRKSKSLDNLMLEDSITKRKMPEKAVGVKPTIKKTPTFSDSYLNDTWNNRLEGSQTNKAEQPEAIWYPRTNNSRKEETEANVWEKERMTKIRKWYEKMNSKILQWENKKKMKAKRRQERKEREVEEMRARHLQEFRIEIAQIDKMASGARAASEARKRSKELKIKEKAKQKRSKGKVPSNRKCFCF